MNWVLIGISFPVVFLIILCILKMCEKSQEECTDKLLGHQWGKWEPIPEVKGMEPMDCRRCDTCGLYQEQVR